MLRRFVIGVASVYVIGVLLTGFTFVLQRNYSDGGSVSMVSASVSHGILWPVHAIKVLGRVIR
ncbi:MAG: hypothetical protein ACE5JZ_09360 [Kiloniellales bacterium]